MKRWKFLKNGINLSELQIGQKCQLVHLYRGKRHHHTVEFERSYWGSTNRYGETLYVYKFFMLDTGKFGPERRGYKKHHTSYGKTWTLRHL